MKGLAIAVVTQNKDPEGLCRVKVSYPWHEKPTESYWARLAMPMAGDDRGLVLIPEVGDEVLVGFEREDLRFPHVLGSLGTARKSHPRQIRTVRTTSASCNRARSTTCCSTTAPKARSSSSTKKAVGYCSTTTAFSSRTRMGTPSRSTASRGAITIEAKGTLSIKAASITIEATGTLNLNAERRRSAMRGSLVNIN